MQKSVAVVTGRSYIGSMTTVDKSIERIRGFVQAHNWTRFKMAREAKLSPNCLRGLYEPSWNPTAETLRAIEAVIDDAEAPKPSPEPAQVD